MFLINKLLIVLCVFSSVAGLHAQSASPVISSSYFLIAHRGGVVDSSKAENSRPAIEAAIVRGYKMVEIDVRLTKDSVLIIHHDRDFKRYFGVPRLVASMTWTGIRELKSDRGGSGVLLFEDALAACSERIGVMIDFKIEGLDTALFGSIVGLLKKYKLDKNVLMIGTEESTPYFTGKVPQSCTRQQLENYMKRPGFNAVNYYLFSHSISADDVKWAKKHNIRVVGVLNEWRYRREADPAVAAENDFRRLQEAGVRQFQLDSVYDRFFLEKNN